MILVYTHKITPRLRYIFKHVFLRILFIEVDFTVKIEDFVAHNGAKMSYTKLPLGNEFFVRSNDLLFEQGVSNLELNIQMWDNVPCFYSAGPKSSIPFDIFAASFYLISRYEEYLPHVKDSHGRFNSEDSIAFKYRFLEKPVVDIWALKLRGYIVEKFPNVIFKKKEYKYISTLDIDNAFAYKHKSIVRTIAGLSKDFFSLQLRHFWDRIFVLFNLRKDPYYTFPKILELSKKYDISTLMFFLVGNHSTYDTNISASNTTFRLLIKHVFDYVRVGMHPSYYTLDDAQMLKKEKLRLEKIINSPVSQSRQHYLRLSLPETYQYLIDLEIQEDYTMGYADKIGFRASTCTPFYFYDLDHEIQTPLKIFPFALMDTTLNDYLGLTPRQSLGKIRDIYKEVKAVDGTLITLFHNESISGYLRWRGWQQVYESMLEIVVS